MAAREHQMGVCFSLIRRKIKLSLSSSPGGANDLSLAQSEE